MPACSCLSVHVLPLRWTESHIELCCSKTDPCDVDPAGFQQQRAASEPDGLNRISHVRVMSRSERAEDV